MGESTTMSGMKATKAGDTQAMKDLQARMPEGIEPAELTEPWNRETDDDLSARRRARHAAIFGRWDSRRPAMYAGAVVASLDEDQHRAYLSRWLESGGLHLVLAGPVGTGKTYAAYAIGNLAVAQDIVTEAWTVHDLMAALRPNSSEPDALTRVTQASLLILDDLDATATEWEAETLTALMDARVREERRTIVTTNITSEQITAAWGARLMDRLHYRLQALTFKGESRRKADW